MTIGLSGKQSGGTENPKPQYREGEGKVQLEA